MVRLDFQEFREPQANQVPKDRKANEAHPGTLDQLGHQGPWEKPAYQAPEACKATLDQRVQKDRWANLEKLENREKRGRVENQAEWESEVRLDQQ